MTRSYGWCWAVFALATGCGFSSGPANGVVDAAIDAPIDAPVGTPIDAPIGTPFDAPDPDAAIDAPKLDGAAGTARKRSLTISDAKVFGDLPGFPVWLVIDDLAGLGSKASASGGDIYFTKPDGTPLEHQRMVWTKSTGHLEAWVRLDLLDTTPTVFDLRFGDPAPAHGPDPAMTFSNGFQAVWHCDDTLATTTVSDARGVVNGTAVNGPSSAAAGKLGRAIDFDGNDDEITFNNPITAGNSSTISAWVSIANPTKGFSSVMTVGNAATNQSRFFHTKFAGLATGFYGNDAPTAIDIHNSQFTLLHWVYDGIARTSTLYRDGQQVAMSNVTGTINTTGTAGHIGNAPMPWGPGGTTPNPINGLVDEVRIASAPRSPAWVRTEFANQSDVAAFFTIGPDLPAF